MFGQDLKQAIREQDAAVEREAAKLVRAGIPLWPAIAKAGKCVRERQSRRAYETRNQA